MRRSDNSPIALRASNIWAPSPTTPASGKAISAAKERVLQDFMRLCAPVGCQQERTEP
jgi:hypothetical protein